jgi:hypothetical protein
MERKNFQEETMKEKTAEKKLFTCKVCGSRKESCGTNAGIPECCDLPMERIELPPCELAAVPEHARLDEGNEPCDDGRAGKG